jgi:hypothetical protein
VPSEDYAKATAAPRYVTINGREYRVGKYGPRDIGDLEAWLKTQVPDPRLMARELCAGLPDAVALEVWRDLSAEAMNWPPDVTSRIGNKLLMNTWEGHARLVFASLSRHNADFTLDEARTLTKADCELAIEISNLSWPEPTFDPKGQPAMTPVPI